MNFITNDASKTLFICGQPGTGKTSLLLELFNQETRLCKECFSFKIYINCMSVHSIDEFYSQVFAYFKKTENRELDDILTLSPSNKNLLKLFDALDEHHKPIIVLDEIDYFYSKNKDIEFYEMLKLPYLTDRDVKMIMISNNSEFDKEILPKVEDKKIKVVKVVFSPYTHIEIYEILTNKLKLNDTLRYFQDDAVRLISKKYANSFGDLRPALEIVKNMLLTNKEALVSGSERIALKDVLAGINKKDNNFVKLIRDLTVEQKLVITSVYNVMKKKDTTEYDEKDVRCVVIFR
jgi:Cdc6-like AAA superfamily ATPase